MKIKLIFILVLFLCPYFLIGQRDDTTKIPQVEIFYQPGSGGLTQVILEDSQSVVSSTLGDLFEKNTSVFINSNGVSGLQSISIRGTGSSHTTVFWNGLSIQSPTLGTVDFSTLSPSTIDQVEIHYGASSLVDGSGGLGGSIQLSDRLMYDSLFRISLRTGFGSYGKSYRNLKFNWGNNKWSTLLALGDVDAPNVFAFVNPSTSNLRVDTLKNAAIKTFSTKIGVGYQWNEKVKLEALVWYNSANRQLPKNITASDFGEDHQTDQSWRSVVNLTINSEQMTHQLSFGVIQDSLHYYSGFESRIKTQSFQGNYRRTYYLKNFRIKSALEFCQKSAHSDGFKEVVFQDKLAWMFNPQWKWKKIFVADMILRAEAYDNKIAPLMPSILLYYKIADVISMRATGAIIYRHPTFNDLYWTSGGNPDLLPENGTSFELGVDLSTPNKRTEFSITGFYSEIENWIIWLPEGNFYSPRNLYLVTSEGVDVDLKNTLILSKKIKFNSRVNYSFVSTINSESTISDDPSLGKQIVYAPKNKLNAGIEMLINDKWKFSYQYRFTDIRFITKDHSSWMPYFMISDIGIQYNLPNFRWVEYVNLNVNNLLNKNYEVIPYQPMMQRNVMVNLKFNFEQ